MQSISTIRTFRSIFTTLCVLLIVAVMFSVGLQAYRSEQPKSEAGELAEQRINTPIRTEKTPQAGDLGTEETYKTITVEPASGNAGDFKFTIQQCYRSEDSFKCFGKALNKSDAPANTVLNWINAVDDEGNAPQVHFTTLNRFRLLPDTPYNIPFRIDDAHRNVKTVTIEIALQWKGEDYTTLVFNKVPVQ